ncbi:MAG: ATP-binding protein [Bacteroidota bacterium]
MVEGSHYINYILAITGVSTWHEVIGESNIADAILDRLVHSAHCIQIE